MPDHEYVVLSMPPEGVSAEQYNEWYDVHMRQILELEGFVSAQRSALTLRGRSGETPAYEYMVRYGIDGELDAALANLRAAVDSGRMSFPDWFPDVRSVGFESSPVTGTVLAAT